MKKNDSYLANLLAEQKRINKEVSVTIEIITPEAAMNYLQNNLRNNNIKNRKINATTVNGYVKDILSGRWKIGAPIIFGKNNGLLDGQTRCTAVVKAQKPIMSIVVRGVDDSIFDVLDCGKRRTHKDVLTTLVYNGKQLTKPAGVSAGINLLKSVSKNHKDIANNRGFFTNPELFELVKNNFDYYNEPFESGKISKWRKNINLAIRESIVSGFYYAKKQKHGDVVDNFLTTITSSTDKTPAIVREFRDMMIENKGKKSDERGYLRTNQVYGLIECLFKYSQEPQGLNRKHFSKKDLKEIYG